MTRLLLPPLLDLTTDHLGGTDRLGSAYPPRGVEGRCLAPQHAQASA
jgi:hypothetical protein